MVNESGYRNIIKKFLKHRQIKFSKTEEEYLDEDDNILILYLLGYLNEDIPKDINIVRMAKILKLTNKEVKQSIKRLKKANILKEKFDHFNFGYILDSTLDDNKKIK